MLNIHVTGCNVCPFAVYEYQGGVDEWVCNLIRYINPTANEYIHRANYTDYDSAPTTIPDKCPLDITITK